jgi:Ca-activated chloride channel family protein
MNRTTAPAVLLVCAGVLGALAACSLSGQAQPVPSQQPQQQITNMLGNQRGDVGPVGPPVPFTSKDGQKNGWKVVIPGKRPLATPAVAGDRVFLGGGFGSHEFYAFDALTGKKVWQYATRDDGPTAAVVADGYVAFNTESCELEILTVQGKPVWKKWLGDPLMSMPAIADGKIYMAYPNSKGDRQHYLACFELTSGKELWKKPIAGEIITAPVVVGEQVYLATLEGSLHCFGSDGSLVWKEKRNATSAPVVWKDRCYFSRRDETTIKKAGKAIKQQHEELALRGKQSDAQVKALPQTRRPADYLDYRKRANSGIEVANQNQDASVGFPGATGGMGTAGFKGDANIGQAQMNLGQATVAGVWSYQGSRPIVSGDRLYSAMGDTLQCLDPRTEKVLWKKNLHEGKRQTELLDAVLTPPALVNGKLFLGTAAGEVLCLSAESGARLWSVHVGEPITFQPAIARGRVYVATSAGSLICLETGDPRDDGWLMWGATASHNGIGERNDLAK